MVLRLKGQRSWLGLELGLGYSNTAWVRTELYECLLVINVILFRCFQKDNISTLRFVSRTTESEGVRRCTTRS